MKTNYTTGSMVDSKGMLYAKRLSDGKEFFLFAMTIDGAVKGSKDGEIAVMKKGSYKVYRKKDGVAV